MCGGPWQEFALAPAFGCGSGAVGTAGWDIKPGHGTGQLDSRQWIWAPDDAWKRSDGPMISSSRSRRPTRLRAAAAALVVCASALLCGCSGSLIADHLTAAVGGLPEGAPARPATAAAYPAVHNMPPARPSAPLNPAQPKQL